MSDSGEFGARQEVLERLLQATARGDARAFSMLYAQTSASVYGLILSMTNYSPAGEDLLQEVYVKVWKNADRYVPGKARVTTWLTAIARNRTLDWLRSQGSGMNKRTVERSPEALDLAASDEDPQHHAERAVRESALAECLDGLHSSERQAIVLAFLEGHTHAELAERLASPLGTVKSWVRRGLERLRQCLRREGGLS